MKTLIVAVLAAASMACRPDLGVCADEKSQDMMMILQNVEGPFVTAKFAKRLGLLVMAEKYPGVVVASGPPQVLDKGDTWWVTIKIRRWVTPALPSVLAPKQLTVWVRKQDAAIVSIR